MIHYTCDRCKRQINTDCQTRYVVKIEVQTAQENAFGEFDDDVDHLSELHQILEGNLTGEDLLPEGAENTYHGSYDLCPECHENFLRNPLGRDAVHAIGFSNN